VRTKEEKKGKTARQIAGRTGVSGALVLVRTVAYLSGDSWPCHSALQGGLRS
jgi:hypothetical protein